MKLGIAQIPVCVDRAQNVNTAEGAVERLAARGADLIVLPEMFTTPYDNAAFAQNAEDASGETCTRMADAARSAGVFLVAGSIPERAAGRLYNSSFVFDPNGSCIARHRKAHLFDINVTGGQAFRESDTLTAGDAVTVFDTPFGRVGLCICFDIRFPELSRAMADDGAGLIVCPAAFNLTTGPAHWALTLRARALDNQLFVAACAPARDEIAPYVSYAHSLVASPWGDVITQAGTKPEELVVEVDFAKNDEIRVQLPLLAARRRDLY